ncbi:unnamed protein product, partial [Anisakis simplex]|uniref:Salivary secreted protein n=1 Tax=Anisakis simplex TaxID=6269 RepID=A0A0M3JQ97_ANISI
MQRGWRVPDCFLVCQWNLYTYTPSILDCNPACPVGQICQDGTCTAPTAPPTPPPVPTPPGPEPT